MWCGTVFRMRILMVGDPGQPHTLRWADGLARAGADVALAGFGEDPEIGVAFHRLGSAKLREIRYPLALPALRRAISIVEPDVIHAHFVSSYGILAALAAGSCPVIQFAWGSDVLWHARRRAWHRHQVVRTLRRARIVIVDADDVSVGVAGLAPGVEIELVRFGPDAAWTVVPRDEQRSILSPRQLKGFYNVESIVRAFAAAGVAADGWRLDILTGGSPADHLRDLAEGLGVAACVTLWPHISRDVVQRLFLEAAILCSVPSTDATSAAVLEGMAAGTFPILSDVPANRALVGDGTTGLVVPAGDVGALADALRVAIADPDRRAAAAAVNRAWVRDHATWEVAVSAAMAATDRALRAPTAPRTER